LGTALLLATLFWLARAARSPETLVRDEDRPLAQRAMALCAALDMPCAPVAPAWRFTRDLPHPLARRQPFPITVVTCQTEDWQFDIAFDQQTGRPFQFMGMNLSAEERANPRALTPIASPEEAARMAAKRLTQLEILPADARVTLDGPPEYRPRQQYWRVQFQVQPAGQPAYPAWITLTRNGGIPIIAADLHRFRKPAPPAVAAAR
jgi:hypothetical protein